MESSSMPLISMIVPVYNVEPYLPQCMESILAQDYPNYEVILMDDGSTDQSGSMCDQYADQYERVYSYHQSNKGLSAARNAGVRFSHGEYIAFVDSDDFVSPGFLTILYHGMEKYGADITEVKRAVVFQDGQDSSKIILTENQADCAYEEVSATEAIRRMLYQKIPAGAPFRLYRKEIFHQVLFPEGYLHEDLATAYLFFLAVTKIVLVDAKIYAYRMRSNSIVHMDFDQRKMVMIQITRDFYQKLCAYDQSLEKAAASRALSGNFLIFLQVPWKNRDARKTLWREIKKYRMAVLLDKSPDVRRQNKLCAAGSYLGMDFAWWMGKRLKGKAGGSLNANA